MCCACLEGSFPWMEVLLDKGKIVTQEPFQGTRKGEERGKAETRIASLPLQRKIASLRSYKNHSREL